MTAAVSLPRVLFDVEPWDVQAMVASALLAPPVLLASYGRARKAAKVSPVDVHRTE